MQTKRDNTQQSMELMPSLEEQIPEDYYLRRLNRVLDLRFVHELVRPLYCQANGRPSVDPEVVIRLFLLQAITGTSSVRELLREAQLHLGWRWFIGYGAAEALPDHSTLSRALTRFGDEVFNEVFRRSIAQCRASGLIEGRILHLDATTIRADLDKDQTGKAGASDQDARFGRFPGGVKAPGYKQQTLVDDSSRVIVALEVMPANVNEGSAVTGVLEEALDQTEGVEAICADSAYASGFNNHLCEQAGVRLVSPPRAARNHHSGNQYPIEQFQYDEERDVFICPAGRTLERKGRSGNKDGRWKYMASARDCGSCPVKAQCTQAPQRGLSAGEHHGSLVRLRQDSRTFGFRWLYRRRSSVVEGVFAEGKEWHGLRRAWRRGLAKVRVQCLLIAAVLNFKRLGQAVLRRTAGVQALQRALAQLPWPECPALAASWPRHEALPASHRRSSAPRACCVAWC